MPVSEKHSVLLFHTRGLPLSTPPAKEGMRSCLLTCLLVISDPALLNQRITKDLAESLEVIIRDEQKNPLRVFAIEVFGLGYAHWEPHINGAGMLRHLTMLTGLGNTATQAIPVAVMMMARQTLLVIASINTPLFINTFVFDLMHSRQTLDRVARLKLLGGLILKVGFHNLETCCVIPVHPVCH